MYWLNGIASELSLDCTVPKEQEHQEEQQQQQQQQQLNSKGPEHTTYTKSLQVVSMQPSSHASLYITCTRNGIYLWSVKPTTVLAFVERSDHHVEEFGENLEAIWKPDATAIVVHTKRNYMLLYAIISYDQRSFEFNFPNSTHAYVTGPGEGKGPKAMLIKFKLAIRVDAGIACGTSSDDTLIIATQSPAAIQSLSWNPQQVSATQTSVLSRLGIMENEKTEHVVGLVYDKTMNISVWLSNQGRAYFVQNNDALSQERRSSNGSSTHNNTTTTTSTTTTMTSPSTPSFEKKIHWTGVCFHNSEHNTETKGKGKHDLDKATSVAVNAKFSLIAIGTNRGVVYVYSASSYTATPVLSHTLALSSWASQNASVHPEENAVESLAWTSDGYAIAVGYKTHGLAVWSVYGGLLCASSEMDDVFGGDNAFRLKDIYVKGIHSLFWGPGNHQLYVLSRDRMFTIPFAKSALTSYLHADNAKRGLLLADDRILLYNNGGDYQENNTTIDPAAVAWTHIQYPALYITDHWPIRYASISSDGKYMAIAGKRGFAHYNAISNRWKLFGNQHQEQSFLVRGGMVWHKNIIIVACESLQYKTYEIRMYSRDSNLDNTYILHTEALANIPAYMTLCGSFLLVYTSENVLNMYNISVGALPNGSSGSSTGKQGGLARLELVRRVSLRGIVARVARVRSISLFHPVCGDQLDSLENVVAANILLLVDGKLIMLCPKAPDDNDTSDLASSSSSPLPAFDIHNIHHKAEYYWIGKKSIDNLTTSLWIADGKGLKTFTNLLLAPDFDFTTYNTNASESEPSTPTTPGLLSSSSSARNVDIGRPFSLGYRIGPEPHSRSSSADASLSDDMENPCKWRIANFERLSDQAIYIPLDFYPLSILLDKGIIVGIEQNISYRDSLGFVLFKMSPKMHLFLHHILRYLLQRDLEQEAVVFARAYEKFVYFGHALEILLHTVLEEEAGHDLGDAAILPLVIKFLDQFPHALDVIVSCARKTEVALWDHLFSAVGKPKDLFEICLADGRLRTATSYLIILQTMQPLVVGGKDTIRLLQKAMDESDYELCKELVRFLSSIDNTGQTLQEALGMIKSRMESQDPLSPNSNDAQIDKVAQSMRNLSSA